MHRRKFLSAAAAAPALLAHPSLGQAPADAPAAAKPGVDIPGYGRVSLDPADYDAERIARLLQSDVPQAVGLMRSYYGGAAKALGSMDTKQMAALAGPLIQQASLAAALPFVGKGLKEALMSAPQLTEIQAGTGTPVYYVNGIFTSRAIAEAEARALAGRLPGRPVTLLYNAGADPKQNAKAAAKDVEEAYRDRVWPVYLTGLLTGKSLGAGVQQALSGDSPLQHNPTTRGLASVLYRQAEKSPAAPIALVGYSQGSMIVRNALFTLAILGKQGFVERQVACVTPGLPINRQEIWPVPKKLTVLIDPADPIPAWLGMEGEGFKTQGVAAEHHRWMKGGYADRITPAMLTL